MAKSEKEPAFVRWINETGPAVVAEKLNVTIWAVYGWRKKALAQKGGSYPTPERMSAIIRLAKGKLSAADIYAARREAR